MKSPKQHRSIISLVLLITIKTIDRCTSFPFHLIQNGNTPGVNINVIMNAKVNANREVNRMNTIDQRYSRSFSSTSSNAMLSRLRSSHESEIELPYCEDIERGEEKNDSNLSRFYLRFSPLVGGPAFLPIHVEVMFLDYTYVTKEDAPLEILHRFDFLPAYPNDKSTILNLLSLQSVPGLVRHRILVGECDEYEIPDGRRNTVSSLDGGKHNGQNYSIVPSQRIAALLGKKEKIDSSDVSDSAGNDKAEDVTSVFNIVYQLSDINLNDIPFRVREGILPVRVPQGIAILLEEKSGMELHLWSNNCYTFALDILKSIKLIRTSKMILEDQL